jgi:hypothetical protein
VLLGLSTAAIVLIVLLALLYLPQLRVRLRALRDRSKHERELQFDYDPGRERRAELRAQALLRSCVGGEEWEMYRDLGFLRVWGSLEGQGSTPAAAYAYLIYPHRPIVAYLPQTGVLLNEYCVTFPDHTRPYGSTRLPDSDDVLAKWMALTADEKGLISRANMHMPGRQLDPRMLRRDLQRLSRWERARLGLKSRHDGSVRAR